MPSSRQRRGTEAEEQAANFLQGKGFVVLDRHVTSRYGEIDILAQDGETIVAVEVKFRQSQKFGTAAESITEKKLGNIESSLQDVLEKRHWQGKPIRIDIITIESTGINHLRGVGPT